MATTPLGQPVASCPADGVTALRFSEAGDALLASSWDGVRVLLLSAQLKHMEHCSAVLALQGVHLFDTQTCATTAVFAHQTPVLDATFQDDGTVLSAGLDGAIKQCVSPA